MKTHVVQRELDRFSMEPISAFCRDDPPFPVTIVSVIGDIALSLAIWRLSRRSATRRMARQEAAAGFTVFQ